MTAAVALVGAGPGDPELLTLRAEALLAQADVVVLDSSIERLGRDFAPQAGLVAVPDGQAQPERVLLAAAHPAGRVVRLYRGDPWLHPAYAVERAALDAAGVPVEAVAGIAVEVAGPALAGVAVHVRSLAVTCTIGPVEALPSAVDPSRTLVATGDDPVHMARVLAAGGDPRLPAAVVPLATPAECWQGLLGAAADAAAVVTPPALLVVGAVAGERRAASRPPLTGTPR